MEKEKKEKEEEEEKSNGKVGTRWVRQKENKMSKKVEVPPLSSHHYHQNYHHCYYNYHPYCHWYFFCHSRKTKIGPSCPNWGVVEGRGFANLGNAQKETIFSSYFFPKL